jgi:phage tail sheath gpL-like
VKTRIHLAVVDQDNLPAANEEIILVGNRNIPGQAEIKESFSVRTAENGQVALNFGAGSVVSRFWYAGAVDKNRAEYEEITIEPGSVKRVIVKR